MEKKYILGFDVGTSESKGTLIDFKGTVLATAAAPHGLISPKPGFAEHDPKKDWMGDLRIIVRKLLEQVNGKADEIAAIGISTIMAAVTFVDDNCEPLRNAILYGIDTRCVDQVESLNVKIGSEKLQKDFGGQLTIEHFGPKILWVKENEPQIFEKTRHITFASGFLTARLTGQYYVDKYSASAALPMLNPSSTAWDEEYCKLVCPIELLPNIAESTYSIIGKVNERGAKESGLAVGTSVICGTTDGGAEAVSAGVVCPGDVFLMYGSTSFFVAVTKDIKEGAGTWIADYTIDHLRAATGGMATTGSLTRWIKDELAKDLVSEEKNGGENAYTALFREAEKISVGSDGLIVLPYFQGERMPIQDPKAKGVFFGLNLGHTRGHIVHAAFEGVGYGIAQNLQILKESGIDIKSVMAVGGGTKSLLWLQVVSDICGITQMVPEVGTGASYGDALMAAMAIGAVSSVEELKSLIKVKHIIKPDMEKHQKYQELLKIYIELYERNKDLMHQI